MEMKYKKKIVMCGCLVCALLLAVLTFAACSCNDNPDDGKGDEIILSFGGETRQYFNGDTELYPIKSDQVSDADAVEKATVILQASGQLKMRLIVEYEEGYADIQGLMISVNDAEAVPFADKAVLYTSAEAEMRAEVKMVIFLKDSPLSEKGKTIKFYFKLDEVKA